MPSTVWQGINNYLLPAKAQHTARCRGFTSQLYNIDAADAVNTSAVLVASTGGASVVPNSTRNRRRQSSEEWRPRGRTTPSKGDKEEEQQQRYAETFQN